MNPTILLIFLPLIAADVDLLPFFKGHNQLSASLYKEIAKETTKNLFFSPYSAESALALLQSGALGPTGEEIRSSLQLPSTKEKTEEIFKFLTLTGDRYTLRTANKIYVAKGFTLKKSYQQIARNIFKSEVENIDFREKDLAAGGINKWVEDRTQKRIKNLIDPLSLSSDTRALLVNALYFKAEWAKPFESLATKKKEFRASLETISQLPTMSQVEYFDYYECGTIDAKLLRMYFLNKNASMTFVLPNKIDGLTSMERKIESVLAERNFTQERVLVSLPKFTIDYKIQLKEVLKKLGIRRAFLEDAADFGGLAEGDKKIFISDVVQKAFVDVNEGGVEAAAATFASVVTRLTVVPEREPKKFIADHPFVAYIKVKDVIVFVGRFTSL